MRARVVFLALSVAALCGGAVFVAKRRARALTGVEPMLQTIEKETAECLAASPAWGPGCLVSTLATRESPEALAAASDPDKLIALYRAQGTARRARGLHDHAAIPRETERALDERAVAVLDRAMELAPSSLTAARFLVAEYLLHRIGPDAPDFSPVQARVELDIAITRLAALAPDDPYALSARLVNASLDEDAGAFVSAIGRAKEKFPRSWVPRYFAAWADFLRGEVERASEALREIQTEARDPLDPAIDYARLALERMARGKTDDAEVFSVPFALARHYLDPASLPDGARAPGNF